MTKLQKNRYLRCGPACPDCGSPDLQHGLIDFIGRTGRCDVSCVSCRSRWVEIYRLVNIKRPTRQLRLRIATS